MIISKRHRYLLRAATLALAVLAGAGQFVGVSSGVRSASAANPACEAQALPLPAFDDIRGVRTKWQSLTRDERNTIEPDLAGLPLKQWMTNLESISVGLAEINLDPANKLAVQPVLSDADLMQAVSAVYIPAAERTDAQRARVSELEQHIIPNKLYTPAQRDEVQLDFLRRLEELRQRGEIAGSVRFLIHQRIWFRPARNMRGEQREQERAAEFTEDMAAFIRRAEGNCLGHWLAGIRLGEHSNNNMSELLPLLVELARGINIRTGGWLKRHLFLANGGGWGAEYRGIDRVVDADGRPYAFFPAMAAETGGFAFAYKWMQFRDELGTNIIGHMAEAQCASGRPCDPNSVADWEMYLGDNLGFNELKAYIVANRPRYPRHANVVFAGDSSDALSRMVRIVDGGRIADGPELTALRHLFIEAGPSGFSGSVFMNGYSTAATMRQASVDGRFDIGRALYFVDGSGKARLLPNSRRLWQRWPGG